MFLYLPNFILSTIYQYSNFTNKLILNNESKYEILDCIFWKISSTSQSSGIELHDISKNIIITRCGFYLLTCTIIKHGAACIYIDYSNTIKCSNLCFINSMSNGGASYIFHTGVGNILYADLNYSSESDIGKNSRSCEYSSHLGASEKLLFYNSNISNCETNSRGIIYFLQSKNNSIIGKYLLITNSIGEGLITTYLNGSKAILINFNLINNTAKSNLIFNPWTFDILTIENSIFINYNNLNFHNSLKCLLTFSHCYFSGLEINAKSSGAIFLNCNFNIFGNFNLLNQINTYYCWNLGIYFSFTKKNYYILNLFIFNLNL